GSDSRQVCGICTTGRGRAFDAELRVRQAQQVGHTLVTFDAADLSSAVVDVEVLRIDRKHNAAAKVGCAAGDLQQRRCTDDLEDRVEALRPAAGDGVEGRAADGEGVGADA